MKGGALTEQLANLAQTTLAAPIGAPAAGTSEVIQVKSAAGFPTEPVFRVNLGGGELGKVTAVSGTTWTVERGAENTTPVAHPAGQPIIGVLTKAALEAFEINEAQLPSSVVSGSPTGGVSAWKAKTAYTVNQLRQNAEVTYICLEGHESGETFGGVGTHWAPLAGFAVEVSAPLPTGVAATDTANLEAALEAAKGGLLKLPNTGKYRINKELLRPFNTSIYGPPTVTLEAAPGYTGTILSDSKTERTLRQAIFGGFMIDSANTAQHALWCRYFQRGLVLGVVCQNSTQSDCILGDNTATETSDEAFFTEQFGIDRRSGAVPAGAYCLWLQNCSDSCGHSFTMTGQERGIRLDKSDCKFFDVHPLGAGHPMNVCIEDNGLLNEWHAPEVDTPTPIEHAGATGSAASGVITDASILSQHKGQPVSGTNIPANSYVGAVTSGVSFILATNNGTEVKPTGEVKGITLMGVGIMLNQPGTRILGGGAYISPTYGVDNGAYAIVNSSIAVNGLIIGFTVFGGDSTHRFTQPFVGNVLNMSWVGLLQSNCVSFMGAQTQLTANHGTTLKLTNSATGNYLEVTNQESHVVAKINSSGQLAAPIVNVNTTGKTSAEITTAVEAGGVVVTGGLTIVDETNKLMLFYSGAKWLKTAALTEIA